jgi:hypothetical protein
MTSVQIVAAAVAICSLHLLGGLLLGLFIGGRRSAEALPTIVEPLHLPHAEAYECARMRQQEILEQVNLRMLRLDAELLRASQRIEDRQAQAQVNRAIEDLRNCVEHLRSVFDGATPALVEATPGRPAVAPSAPVGAARETKVSSEEPVAPEGHAGESKLTMASAALRRLPFRCLQYVAEWPYGGAPPLDSFHSMQFVEISTEEVVIECPRPPRSSKLVVGLGTLPTLVLLRAEVTGTRQLDQEASGTVHHVTCRFTERMGRHEFPSPPDAEEQMTLAAETMGAR